MRVAIATESFLPSVNGVTNSVLRILDFLDAYGHEALVIAPETDDLPKRYLDFPVKPVPAIQLKRFIPIGIPRLAIRHLIEGFDPDVVHLASPALFGAYVSRAARELKIPCLSVYQTDVANFARHYGFTLGTKQVSKFVARLHDRTDRTLVPSQASFQELNKFGTRNIHIWPRGVDLMRFTPRNRDASLRNSWGASQKIIIGYVGRLAAEKSLEDLEVLLDIPDVQLVIVGDGPEKRRLEKRLTGAIFAGARHGSDLASYYASFDFFVHTGRNETFCQTIQEALASGVPVLAPRSGGPIDLITDGRNGFLYDPRNVRDLPKCLSDLRNLDPEELSFAARESVSTRDWTSINKALLDHYKAISKAHNRVEEYVA